MNAGLRSFASWFTQTALPRARANNGKVVLVRCGNRAERRAAARFERRHCGTGFAQADHLLKTVFPPKRPRRA